MKGSGGEGKGTSFSTVFLKGSMRRRDKLFLGVAWAALLAGLGWALATQSRWVQDHAGKLKARPAGHGTDPAQADPGLPAEAAPPAPPGATGVIGTVSEDTYKAMAKDLAARKQRESAAATAARSRPSDSSSR